MQRSRSLLIATCALAAGALSVAVAAPARAADVRHGTAIVIGPGETIDDDLYVFGQTVEIRGAVHGDVIAFGRSVEVSGPVDGDVFAAAESVRVSGKVAGSTRTAGQVVTLDAPVGRDALVAAGDATLTSQAHVTRDALLAGRAIQLQGPVDGGVQAAAGRLALSSTVGRDVRARADTLRLEPGADVKGSLRYESPNMASIASSASVGGKIDRIPLAPPGRRGPAAAVLAVVGWFRTLAGLFALGLVLVLVYPSFARRSAATIGDAPWGSLGAGAALLLGVPILAALVFALGLLVGGWWLALAGLSLYLLAIAAAFPVAGFAVGRFVLQRLGDRFEHRVGAMLLGLALILLIAAVPILGGLVALAVICFGLGAMLLAATSRRGSAVTIG